MSRLALEEEPVPPRTKPSQSQQEKLLQLFSCKPWLCTGPPRSGYARDRNRAAWQEIAAELNTDATGCHKTWKRWAKFWSDKRSSIKKKVRQRTIERLHASGATELDSELTVLEEQMLALMGGEAVVLGDRDPTLNPYIPHVSVEYGSNEDLNTPSQSLDCSGSSPPRAASPPPPAGAMYLRARRCCLELLRRHPAALIDDPAFQDLLTLIPMRESERLSLSAALVRLRDDSDEPDDEGADSGGARGRGDDATEEATTARVKSERADSAERDDCHCHEMSEECAGCARTHAAHATHGTDAAHNNSMDNEDDVTFNRESAGARAGAGGPPRAKRRRASPAPADPPASSACTSEHTDSECKRRAHGGCGAGGAGGALDVFGQYVAALLRGLPARRRLRLQRQIVARLIQEQAAAG